MQIALCPPQGACANSPCVCGCVVHACVWSVRAWRRSGHQQLRRIICTCRRKWRGHGAAVNAPGVLTHVPHGWNVQGMRALPADPHTSQMVRPYTLPDNQHEQQLYLHHHHGPSLLHHASCSFVTTWRRRRPCRLPCQATLAHLAALTPSVAPTRWCCCNCARGCSPHCHPSRSNRPRCITPACEQRNSPLPCAEDAPGVGRRLRNLPRMMVHHRGMA